MIKFVRSKQLMIVSITVVALALSAMPIQAFAGDGFAVLKSSSLSNYNDAVVAFKTGCSNIVGEVDLEDDMRNASSAAKTIAAKAPAAVFAVGAKAAVAAKENLGSDVPIIYAIVHNPERNGIEGPNVSGVQMDIPVGMEFEAIKSIIPNIRKLGALYNPRKSQDLIDSAKVAAEKLGVELVTARVESPSDTIYALKGFAAGIDAYWLIPDNTVVNKESIATILRYSFKNRIPVFAFHKRFVKVGVLLSLSTSYDKMGMQACELAKKMASGARNVEPEVPQHLEIAVNVKTARSLNLQDISMNAFGYAAQRGYKIEALQ